MSMQADTLLISLCLSLLTISSSTSPSPRMSHDRPVSGSTTRRMVLRFHSYSSLLIGTRDLGRCKTNEHSLLLRTVYKCRQDFQHVSSWYRRTLYHSAYTLHNSTCWNVPQLSIYIYIYIMSSNALMALLNNQPLCSLSVTARRTRMHALHSSTTWHWRHLLTTDRDRHGSRSY